jgi:hypothetical protein
VLTTLVLENDILQEIIYFEKLLVAHLGVITCSTLEIFPDTQNCRHTWFEKR